MLFFSWQLTASFAHRSYDCKHHQMQLQLQWGLNPLLFRITILKLYLPHYLKWSHESVAFSNARSLCYCLFIPIYYLIILACIPAISITKRLLFVLFGVMCPFQVSSCSCFSCKASHMPSPRICRLCYTIEYIARGKVLIDIWHTVLIWDYCSWRPNAKS